ncbi:MAG: phosphatidylcholine/phosphatidylserine synthase [Alphaproteobacteria bacterium]|jgi:CDP-diacylglycerol--serine O-phosphatidyltransferase|nr:phosphatidylcholine/phosphatidylserine synthase [Alphaproteobacteria bacterium]MBP9877896.1 phosphatidylcholine/phosphatidylserine synthase [Alphaproteobacteria bacterium]
MDQNNTRRDTQGGMTLYKLLPNLTTIFAICIGLSAVRFAMIGQWETAILCIFAAGILDSIDGRLARLLNAQSKFGAELDSLADMVNFGVVPALINYFWSLDVGGKFVWTAVLIFTTCMGLRLARFNSKLYDAETPAWATTTFFTGVPAPAAACLSFVPLLLSIEFSDLRILQNHYIIAIWMVFVASLMVSTLPTFSFKGFKVPQRYILLVLVAAVFLITSLILNTWLTLLIIGAFYIGSFPISYRYYAVLRKKAIAKGEMKAKPKAGRKGFLKKKKA